MIGVMTRAEAQARLALGDLAGARACFEATAQMVAVLHGEEMRDMIRMVDAYEAAAPSARDDSARCWQAAFGPPRARQFYDTFDTNPRFGATMCALALEHDVEAGVRSPDDRAAWLCAAAASGYGVAVAGQIATLGRFEVTLRGVPLAAAARHRASRSSC